MDKEIKILADNHKLDQLYQNNLFSIKSICELLGVWNNYTPEQKNQLENLTRADSYINRNFNYKGDYDIKYTYGEVTRIGVETLINSINKYKKITDKDVFVDIGSGSGKLLIHLSIKSNIKTFVGVEIVSQRVLYSKWIKEKISPESSIFFIEKDIKDFDLSIANILFINLIFDKDLIKYIYDNAPKGCHIISSNEIQECKILKEVIKVSVSWGSINFYYYIK